MRGEGPGEFQAPQRLIVLPPDSVLVIDRGRTTVLDATGSYVRDFVPGGAGTRANVLGRLEDGRLVSARTAVMSEDSISSGLHRTNIAFLTLTPTGEVVDTIVSAPGSEREIHVDGQGGQIESIMVSAPPFAKNTVYAAAGDVLVVATQESPEIRVFGADGILRRIIRTGSPMPAVTEEYLEAAFESLREATPGTWSVHDPEGRLIARVRLPERFQLMHIGTDFVLGVERDDLDVEHVRLHRLRKG